MRRGYGPCSLENRPPRKPVLPELPAKGCRISEHTGCVPQRFAAMANSLVSPSLCSGISRESIMIRKTCEVDSSLSPLVGDDDRHRRYRRDARAWRNVRKKNHKTTQPQKVAEGFDVAPNFAWGAFCCCQSLGHGSPLTRRGTEPSKPCVCGRLESQRTLRLIGSQGERSRRLAVRPEMLRKRRICRCHWGFPLGPRLWLAMCRHGALSRL